jgi:SAM-dependent methyltransferase
MMMMMMMMMMQQDYEEQEWIEAPGGWGKEANTELDEDGEMAGDLFGEKDPRNDFRYLIPATNTTICLTGFKVDSHETACSTGVTLWKAAPLLSNFISLHSESFVKGRQVLEIGAGLGLCGIVANHLGAKQVVLTDGDTNALSELRRNVYKNCRNEDTVICRQLLWKLERTKAFKDEFGTFDTILAADVIYVPESINPLFDTAISLMKPEGTFLLSWQTRWNNVSPQLVMEAACIRNLSISQRENGIYAIRRDEADDKL